MVVLLDVCSWMGGVTGEVCLLSVEKSAQREGAVAMMGWGLIECDGVGKVKGGGFLWVIYTN